MDPNRGAALEKANGCMLKTRNLVVGCLVVHSIVRRCVFLAGSTSLTSPSSGHSPRCFEARTVIRFFLTSWLVVSFHPGQVNYIVDVVNVVLMDVEIVEASRWVCFVVCSFVRCFFLGNSCKRECTAYRAKALCVHVCLSVCAWQFCSCAFPALFWLTAG